LIEPERPSGPVAPPSSVVIMFARTHGSAGSAYRASSLASSSGATAGRPGGRRTVSGGRVAGTPDTLAALA